MDSPSDATDDRAAERADESHVSLCVFGFGDDPGVVTSVLGIAPTTAWAKGDPLPRHPKARRTHSRWTLQSPLPLQAHVDDHIEALLSLLEPLTERIRDCAERFPTEFGCAIYYYQDFTPGIHFSEQAVQRTAALGLAIDLDLYFLGGGTDGD